LGGLLSLHLVKVFYYFVCVQKGARNELPKIAETDSLSSFVCVVLGWVRCFSSYTCVRSSDSNTYTKAADANTHACPANRHTWFPNGYIDTHLADANPTNRHTCSTDGGTLANSINIYTCSTDRDTNRDAFTQH
jgi:hypothetical protein